MNLGNTTLSPSSGSTESHCLLAAHRKSPPPVNFRKASQKISISEAKRHLKDFGMAFRPAQESRYESCLRLEIRPPEAYLEPTKPLVFASDIWSLACTIWTILGQRSFLDSFLFSQEDATSDQVDALGPLPPEWRWKWE